jgi:RNA polymerase sigma-70 factor (ECF subfamily)
MQTQFESNIQRFRPILLSIAEAMISPTFRGQLEASDLVQQTFLEAHCDAEKLAGTENGALFEWLRTCLRHNMLDAVKQLKTQKNDLKRQMRISELAESFDRMEQLLVADQTSPSQIAERNEQILIMLAVLQEIPPDQKTAVIMKHLRGCSLKEIAEELNRSESATAGLLHRGRQNLVAAMEGRGQV